MLCIRDSMLHYTEEKSSNFLGSSKGDNTGTTQNKQAWLSKVFSITFPWIPHQNSQ